MIIIDGNDILIGLACVGIALYGCHKAYRFLESRGRSKVTSEPGAELSVDWRWMLENKIIPPTNMFALRGADDMRCNWSTDVASQYIYFMDGLGWPETSDAHVNIGGEEYSVSVTIAGDMRVWFWRIPEREVADELVRLFGSKGQASAETIVSRARARALYHTLSYKSDNIQKYGYCWPETKYIEQR